VRQGFRIGFGAGYGSLGLGDCDDCGCNISIVPVLTWYLGDFDGGSTNVLFLGAGVTFH
jgi:hypothetical protein